MALVSKPLHIKTTNLLTTKKCSWHEHAEQNEKPSSRGSISALQPWSCDKCTFDTRNWMKEKVRDWRIPCCLLAVLAWRCSFTWENSNKSNIWTKVQVTEAVATGFSNCCAVGSNKLSLSKGQTQRVLTTTEHIFSCCYYRSYHWLATQHEAFEK